MTNFNVFVDGGVPIKHWTKGVEFEDEAKKQVSNVSKMPFVHDHIAIMPDVHAGIGATVGSVVPTKGAIIPASCGVDIGCVDADTEYLSPRGWRRIAEYDPADSVLQTTIEGETSWVFPLYVKKPADKFYHLKTKYGIDQVLSPEHRVLVWRITGRNRQRVPDVITAENLVKEHNGLVQGSKVEFQTTFQTPPTGMSLGLSEFEIRLQVAFMADGHLVKLAGGNYASVVTLKKERKIKRLESLLSKTNTVFTKNIYSEGTTVFRFKSPMPNKSYGDFSLFLPESELEIIGDECLKWDGNEKDQVFFTRDKASADFIQYAFSVTGKRATLRVDFKDGKLDYRVFAIKKTKVGLAGSPKSPITEVPAVDKFKYCFVTNTGFWVMRRNGNIVLTGNCGMMAIQTGLTASDLPDNLLALRTKIEEVVPHGRTANGGPGDKGSWADLPNMHTKAWGELVMGYHNIVLKHPKIEHRSADNQIGTLGTGNHFVEVCLDESQNVWAMLHSGSRGPGNKIGQYFIEKAKEDMRRYFINLPDKDLAYLVEGTEHFNDYVEAVEWAQTYAAVNRELMACQVINVLAEIYPTKVARSYNALDLLGNHKMAVNCHHNYISQERHYGENVFVTRKGAVRAEAGELAVIPGSMGAKSFIVRGLGNRESFNSCSHGAGRRMSRTEAKKRFTVQDHIEATKGVECRKDEDVVDETPMAYKSIDLVMDAQKDLVEVVHTLKQVLCIKG